MAAKIKDAIGITPELVPGNGGIFDVLVDNWPLYSKFATGNFPHEEELVEQLRLQAKT